MQAQDRSSQGWRSAIWMLTGLFIAFTAWWVSSPPAPAKSSVYQAAMAVPSVWVEQARVTSPDRQFDAVMVNADPTESLLTAGDGQHPSQLIPTEGKETDSRLLSLRVVPRGARIKRAPPFPFPSRMILDRVSEQSVFVCFDAPELTVNWKDHNTILIQGRCGSVVHKAEKATVAGAEGSRGIEVRYELARANF